MPEENWIHAYWQKINDGSITVGKWVHLIYDYLVNGLEEKQFYFDQKKANKAIEWIEGHCFHTKGTKATKPIELELWQKAFLSAVYGVVDEDGLRQFQEILLIVSRKAGKSVLAAAVGNYEFRENGGFGTDVYCLAPKLEQADIVYDNIWQMIQMDPEWQQLKELSRETDTQHRKVHDDSMLARHRQTDLYIPGTSSKVKKIAFNAKTSDGFNPSLCICDEIAAWEGAKGIKQYEVMASATGARDEPMLFSVTTAGYVSDSIFDELFTRSTRFLQGGSKEKRLLPVIYMIDDVSKWNDINELKKANPNLGISVRASFMMDEIVKAENSLSKKVEFLCKYCNVKQNSITAWFSQEEVQKNVSGKGLHPEDFRRSYCVGGIDLSQTTDLTACCVVIEKNEQLHVLAHFLMPENRIEEATAEDHVPYEIFRQRGFLTLSGENYVDYHDCFNWFRRLVEEYEIYPLKVGYDRFSAQYLVADMKKYGFHMDDVYQGTNLTPVIRELEGIMKDGAIDYGDNSLMISHVLNSALKSENEAQKVRLVKVGKTTRIDGMAALLDAMTVRQKYYGEIGEQLKNRGG